MDEGAGTGVGEGGFEPGDGFVLAIAEGLGGPGHEVGEWVFSRKFFEATA